MVLPLELQPSVCTNQSSSNDLICLQILYLIFENKNYQICLVGTNKDKNSILPIINECKNIINYIDISPPEVIYSIAKKSDLIISNDTGPGHVAALSQSPILFLGVDNDISKSNLSEYKNGYKILTESMDSLSFERVIDFLNEKILTTK